ncbi:hypothetical protein N8Z76_00325 [Gammaproteobacteria bacterium]|nr:hypothetical protein [Gammaproteobacteria bacterium]
MSKAKPTEQSAFFTADLSNEGVKIPMMLPDGTKSEHWMRVRGTDSEHFKIGSTKINQRFLKDAGKAKTDIEKFRQRENKNLAFVSLLISEWSFPEKCNEVEKVKFLRKAPAIVEAIDLFGSDRSNFFAKPSQV